MNLAKNLKNLRHSVYKVGEVRKKPLPVSLAGLLSLGNRPKLPSAVPLITYDHSGQACHPTTAVFQGNTYMACTPYPYGQEAYENPCLYVKTLGSHCWEPVPGAFPFVRPEHLGMEHYSDPCLFQWDDRFILLFRKCERHAQKKTDLLYTISSSDGKKWSMPQLLAEGPGDSLISPAIGGRELFCVEYDGANTRLVRYQINDLDSLGKKSVCDTVGLSQDFLVWHIECVTLPDGAIRGLFMLQKKSARAVKSKLALFRWLSEETCWCWERDVPLTKEEEGQSLYIYKSAFTEDPGKLLCSARDHKGRYFLFEKTIAQEEWL